jgi:hypothetical protein
MAIQPYGMTHESPDLPLPHHADPANQANAQGAAAGKKGRAQRELSNTKRAAQNRAAQRAFRLRKEQHINKLEDDLKRTLAMEENCKTLQHENLALRNYITLLQGKMTDKNISFPPVPDQAPLRSVSISAPDQEHEHQNPDAIYSVPDQQPAQHHQIDEHRYPDPSTTQGHAAASNAYPQPTHDPKHHQHELAPNSQSTHLDSANDSLPAAAISQLQAAAAQAGSMDRPHSTSPSHPNQHQRLHSQDPQYVRASEYPAHKRPRHDPPSHQTREHPQTIPSYLIVADHESEALSDKPGA